MKVCFIMPKSYPIFKPQCKGKIGGAEIQMAILAKELAKDERFRVGFVVGDYGQPETESIVDVELFKFVDLSKRKTFFGKILLAWKLILLLKKIKSDVYITTTANSAVGVVCFFCNLFKRRHVHRTAHDKDVDGAFVRENGLEGLVYLWGLKRADTVFVQSKAHQELLRVNHNKESVLIKNSFELNNHQKVLGFSDRKYILQVTRFFEWKNPYLFLKLAESFPREKFLLICQYGKSPRGKKWLNFKKNVSKLSNVKLLERVPFAEIKHYFDRAKFFVNTSESEGFPNTFIQSGISGTPIISFKVNPDNFIGRFGCGFFCEGRLKELKNKISTLLKDPEVWKNKSDNIFDYVNKNHDAKKNIKTLKDLLLDEKTKDRD